MSGQLGRITEDTVPVCLLGNKKVIFHKRGWLPLYSGISKQTLCAYQNMKMIGQFHGDRFGRTVCVCVCVGIGVNRE